MFVLAERRVKNDVATPPFQTTMLTWSGLVKAVARGGKRQKSGASRSRRESTYNAGFSAHPRSEQTDRLRPEADGEEEGALSLHPLQQGPKQGGDGREPKA
jgi:hypothetical protein